MLISEILSIHKSALADGAHADILGDGFLLRDNRIYRNIKNFALQIGCEYTEAWPQYLSLPFHELNKIVETKKIPYQPSARMLQDIENKRPGVFTVDHLQMPESFHMHEAAHVIAEHLFESVQIKTPQERILKTILCESFANSVDALACVEATTEMHQYFLLQNCYMNPDSEDLEAMNQLIEDVGFERTFKLVLLGYLHANFMRQDVSEDLIIEIIGKNSLAASQIVKMCEKLDHLFRVQTTEMYLRLEGYNGEVFDILNFQFMNVFKANTGFTAAMNSMAHVLRKSS